MPLSEIQGIAHSRDFANFLISIRSPLINAVVPGIRRAIDGYDHAAEAFDAGGKFDAVTDGDYKAINVELKAQFDNMMAVLDTPFPVSSETMTLQQTMEFAISIMLQLNEVVPGYFGEFSAEG